MEEEPLPAQASFIWIGQLATALDDPGAIRLAVDAGDLHPSRREVDHEQDGEARQPTGGPDFDGKEVCGREDASMPAEELLPGRPPLALRSGLDPVLFQNAGDGASADMVIEVGERTLDPGIAPRAVLRRHPDDALANHRGDRWPSRTAALVAVVLPSDQRPMPREQGVRRHDGPHLLQHASTECVGFRGQADSLIVGEPEPPRSELLTENAILLLQIVDDVALLLVDPAGQRDQKEP